MKYVRKPAPVPEPMPDPAPAPAAPPHVPDLSELAAPLREVAQEMMRAAERMQAPATINVEIPKAEASPSAFTVTITKRDRQGRVVEFDVKVKGTEAATDFEVGFAGAKVQ